MSIKKYGIYLAYPPTLDLRAQGLGRYLAEFLKAAQDRKNVYFVIACPSWMKSSLMELLEETGVQSEDFELLTPPKIPILLRMHTMFKKYTSDSKANSLVTKVQYVLKDPLPILQRKSDTLKASFKKRSFPIRCIGGILHLPFDILLKCLLKSLQYSGLISNPKDNEKAVKLFNKINKRELLLLNNLINLRSDIQAWFCPTAFWPEFNEIKAARLTCIPDVFMVDFPISFAKVSNNRLLPSFKQVEKSIGGGEYFVTYSETVKWHTLVQHYHIDPDDISVIPHGANSVKTNLDFSGDFSTNEVAINRFCNRLMHIAMYKTSNPLNSYLFLEGSNIKFLFYASQFRPNKNVISLLRAYNYLLKQKYIGHKLILTGDPFVLPEINEFIKSHNLENEVLCLHGLSAQELAACYKLADLAVNPSLSEGGCPFTLTEALSVDTPVVMARIPVTLEIIKDPDLDKEMLFDPYDCKDMADRIQWALENKEALLAKQKRLYTVLEKRTWRTVVDEYIDILDRISGKPIDIQSDISKKVRKKARLKDAA